MACGLAGAALQAGGAQPPPVWAGCPAGCWYGVAAASTGTLTRAPQVLQNLASEPIGERQVAQVAVMSTSCGTAERGHRGGEPILPGSTSSLHDRVLAVV